MSRPDEIPQDVWDAAILYSGVYAEPAGETLTNLRMDFARAIIAERERCAKVAEDYDGPGLEYGMDYQLGDASRTIYDISNAIRRGTK